MVVVVRHVLNAVEMPEPARRAILQSPLGLLLSADGAVRLFFVLSGWVLAASLARGGGARSVLRFWVRRVFRIHPPYVAALLLSWVAAFVYSAPYAPGPEPVAQSEWLLRLGAIHRSFGNVLSHFAFPGHAEIQLPVGWTLSVEMIFSLLLPLLALVARPFHGLPLLAVAVALLVTWPTVHLAAHALDFTLGIVAFRERAVLQRWLGSFPPAAAAAAVAAAVVLQAAPVVFGWSVPLVGILVTPSDARSGLLMSLGGCGLVLAAVSWSWPARVLAARPVAAIGRASYSLYLVHMPVLFICMLPLHAPLGWIGGLLLLAVVLAVSTGLALLGWRYVERPAIVAGNALSARLGRPDT